MSNHDKLCDESGGIDCHCFGDSIRATSRRVGIIKRNYGKSDLYMDSLLARVDHALRACSECRGPLGADWVYVGGHKRQVHWDCVYRLWAIRGPIRGDNSPSYLSG